MKKFKGLTILEDKVRIEVSTSEHTGQFMELPISEVLKLKNELNRSLV